MPKNSRDDILRKWELLLKGGARLKETSDGMRPNPRP
jgi:hypothetical protein